MWNVLKSSVWPIKGRQETAESVKDGHVLSKESNVQLTIDLLAACDLRRRGEIYLFTS